MLPAVLLIAGCVAPPPARDDQVGVKHRGPATRCSVAGGDGMPGRPADMAAEDAARMERPKPRRPSPVKEPIEGPQRPLLDQPRFVR